MACEQIDTPEEQIRQLQDKLRLFTDFALAHEDFEAAMLNDDSPWFDRMPEEILDKVEQVQSLRNKAMGI